MSTSNKTPSKDALFQNTPSFGTGGIRAVMGEKAGEFNLVTIYRITQALANYLYKEFPKKKCTVVIGYDNRKNSKRFAKEVAAVFSANGIQAYLFSRLRPTPMISFATIYYEAQMAVMITASHNPPEYNGYKVYWEKGRQITSPHDKNIIKEIEQISSFSQIKKKLNKTLLFSIPTSFDKIYLQALQKSSLQLDKNRKIGSSLQIIYTGMHGAGCEVTPKALVSWGFTSTSLVTKQCTIDPLFSFAKKPNPEDKEALLPGVSELLQKKKDLLLANDPDADRVAAIVRHKNKAFYFTGNQIACMLLFYVLKNSTSLPENSAFIKTIVTTDLFDCIVRSFHKTCFEVLTGFKYIAEKITLWEKTKEYTYILGVEESLGYLLSSFVRDKDGVQGSCLIAEMALFCKERGKTLYDFLLEIYEQFGVFRETQVSLPFSQGEKGMKEMASFMKNIREKPFSSILGKKVSSVEDYLNSSFSGLPSSDVLRFYLEDETKIVIRPSGTEPKVKIYLAVRNQKKKSLISTIKECDSYLKSLKGFFSRKP